MATILTILNGVGCNIVDIAETSSPPNANGQATIGLDDPAACNAIWGTGATPPFDCAPIRVDTLSPEPGIGWTYDGVSTLTSPDQTQTVTIPS